MKLKDMLKIRNKTKKLHLIPLVIVALISTTFLACVSSRDIVMPLPGPYPFAPRCSSDEYLLNPIFGLDKNRVLVTDYGDKYNNLGKYHNPLFIAVYANALYKEILDGSYESEEKFFAQVNWLVDNCVERDGMAVWEYHFECSGLEPPWISGLTQGVALGVLTRAYALTNDPRYSEIADKAFKTFVTDMHSGGVRTPVPNGGAFYEEGAREDASSGKTLNGHMGAMVGLWDYYEYAQNPLTKNAFNDGVTALKWGLSKYDAKGTSYYSLNPKRLAPRCGYNIQHVHQLLWLYKVTEKPYFLQYALKFYSYTQRQYEVTVKGSTDPEGHGKGNLYLQFGNHYWSHNQFPTWIELDLGKPKVITEFTIFSGGLEKAFPKDYDILFSVDGQKWEGAIQIRGSCTPVSHHKVSNVEARFIRIVVLADNGNNNVVLTGFGIEVAEHSRDPVALVDFNNFSTAYPPLKLVDGDVATKWIGRDMQGWVIIDLGESKLLEDVRIVSGVDDTAKILKSFDLYASSDLATWQKIVEATDNKMRDLKVDVTDRQFRAQYIKLEFKDRIVSIAEILINESKEGFTEGLE